MRLKILLPTAVLIDTDVSKVIAEADTGAFCLLPRHIDVVANLVPGLLAYTPSDGSNEAYIAVDEGTLVKCGPEVLVSTRQAVGGADLGQLRHTIETQFRRLDARETMARQVLAKLEADTVRRFVSMGETPA